MTFCTDCAKNNQPDYFCWHTLENTFKKNRKKTKKKGLAWANPLKKNKQNLIKNPLRLRTQ